MDIFTVIMILALLVGLVLRSTNPQFQAFGSLLLLGGSALLLAALYLQGRGSKRTYYRHEAWFQRDTWVSLASALCLLFLALLQWRYPSLLYYYPYPPSSPWPGFSPLVGLATTLLAAPALWWPTPLARDGRPGQPDEARQPSSAGASRASGAGAEEAP